MMVIVLVTVMILVIVAVAAAAVVTVIVIVTSSSPVCENLIQLSSNDLGEPGQARSCCRKEGLLNKN